MWLSRAISCKNAINNQSSSYENQHRFINVEREYVRTSFHAKRPLLQHLQNAFTEAVGNNASHPLPEERPVE
jgi:hypothetical protein